MSIGTSIVVWFVWIGSVLVLVVVGFVWIGHTVGGQIEWKMLWWEYRCAGGNISIAWSGECVSNDVWSGESVSKDDSFGRKHWRAGQVKAFEFWPMENSRFGMELKYCEPITSLCLCSRGALQLRCFAVDCYCNELSICPIVQNRAAQPPAFPQEGSPRFFTHRHYS